MRIYPSLPPRHTKEQVETWWMWNNYGDGKSDRPLSLRQIAEMVWEEEGYGSMRSCHETMRRLFKKHGLKTRSSYPSKYSQTQLVDFGYQFLEYNGEPLSRRRYRELKTSDMPSVNAILGAFEKWSRFKRMVKRYAREVERCRKN